MFVYDYLSDKKENDTDVKSKSTDVKDVGDVRFVHIFVCKATTMGLVKKM